MIARMEQFVWWTQTTVVKCTKLQLGMGLAIGKRFLLFIANGGNGNNIVHCFWYSAFVLDHKGTLWSCMVWYGVGTVWLLLLFAVVHCYLFQFQGFFAYTVICT